MDNYQKLAGKIINEIEEALRKKYPKIDNLAKKNKGYNTLFYKEAYYAIEDKVAEIIRDSLRIIHNK